MNVRNTPLRAVVGMLGLFIVIGAAQALTVPNLKGKGLQQLYGTYAPRGDCRSEPRVVVDDSGFAYTVSGSTTHSGTIEWAVSYGGPDYHGISNWFFPFPLSDSDFGRVLMTFNPDEHAGKLAFEPNLGPGESMTALQAALTKHSPYARCGAQGAAVHATGPSAATAADTGALKIDFDKNAVKPTGAQTAAIRRAAASDIKEFSHPGQGGYKVTLADLNDDGRPDLLVQYDDMAFCGSSGCSGVIVMATAHGYSSDAIGLPNFYGEIDILPTRHGGMHDLRFNGDSPIWRWNGKEYDIAKAGAPQSQAPARPTPVPRSTGTATGPGWQTREAAGRTLAMVVATDSVVKSLSVFCDQGKPVLAMLVKARPPAGAVMLTFGFSGYPVVVPMGQGNREGTLWLSDLSQSDLPVWFTHHGRDATKETFARNASKATLAINGGPQGSISLAQSTAATRAALSGCWRYGGGARAAARTVGTTGEAR